jgi:glucan phosphorylase
MGDRRARNLPDTATQDLLESQALYDILEKQIVPLFYKRGVDNVPREWIARMKLSMRKLVPVFNTKPHGVRLRGALLYSRLRPRRDARRRQPGPRGPVGAG